VTRDAPGVYLALLPAVRSPPGVAAATITRALSALRPRNVYRTGKDSRRLAKS